ncbi:hypothetical protein VOLCADRAFT_80526 [Volvox carteri f. nagariensis]|uniref:NADP-dependent oxidoreductase domain-containing protein n=1 Tax=Volvox carteri f. nagariensis TaxID=3068 RepID=D8TS35_VOLCA|nr:uncharacterized protein VOLCADRAFT_80526 [Volvox carteri f. nagariensis]EFJ49624.1 hypothetical protein VOLCADRAFT_80526 [Volvox carteri f. nagariensis]|eukprot:XP_002949131.1 hypothetical protein VOLCADRAFT_80526 [Volvox carteri f. nagariensis]
MYSQHVKMTRARGINQGNVQRTIRRHHRSVKPLSAAAPNISISPSDYTTLGKTNVRVPVMGVGAWSWGDRSGYWGYGREYGKEESRAAFKALMRSGLTFIDTAEVYGFGKSEEFLGEFLRDPSPPGSPAPVIATKFAPLPWRFTRAGVVEAARASLRRMGLSSMGLYMQHWPGYGPQYFFNDSYLEGLADCHQQGLCQAVGVSNFNAERVRRAVQLLGARGIPLASNQVQYSLLYRAPETNGVLEACREAGVTVVSYSPLCQGLLTGKYSPDGPKPTGPRQLVFSESRLREVEPVLAAVRAVAEERGKTMAQVALNWCICKGTLPIPGAKNERQLSEIAGALGWRLSAGEVADLDAVSSRVPRGVGFPVVRRCGGGEGGGESYDADDSDADGDDVDGVRKKLKPAVDVQIRKLLEL